VFVVTVCPEVNDIVAYNIYNYIVEGIAASAVIFIPFTLVFSVTLIYGSTKLSKAVVLPPVV
jgi:hypothetical protein